MFDVEDMTVITDVQNTPFEAISGTISDLVVQVIDNTREVGATGEIVSVSHAVTPLEMDNFAVTVTVVRKNR